ncbi:MAG: hypothetical protein EXR72_12830 [Myxococcales bacterium]|nr:hypothetical protein [Myxococcales bacterium]
MFSRKVHLVALALTLLALAPAARAYPQGPKDAPSPSPTAPATAPADHYRRQLDDLDRRLQDLKSKVFISTGRLRGFQATVLDRGLAGARARIVHRNEMGTSYLPVRLSYALDGEPLFTRADPKGLIAPGAELEVFRGPLAPKNHTLSLTITYRGNDALFSYLAGYTFTLRASHSFAVGEGRETQVRAVAFEEGNLLTTDMPDRPAVDFRVTLSPSKKP